MRLVIDGRSRRLRLTLSALAYLESLYDGKNILHVTKDFAAQGMSAHDVICVLQAGLYGAGEGVAISQNTDADANADPSIFTEANTGEGGRKIGQFDIQGGYARASAVAAQLLETAFLVSE